jgi:acyl-CoA hydrolase
MNTYAAVRQEHLNHNGYLFGGQLLKWVDEFAFIVAARDFTGRTLVTRAMDNIEFRTHVLNGSILRFEVLPHRVGTTSVTYKVDVWSDEPGAVEEKLVFSVKITFVAVDAEGKKAPLGDRPRPLRSEQPVC